MYKYETHLHTSPVSRCASPKATVEAPLRFYRAMGYDGVFLTNHFIRQMREGKGQIFRIQSPFFAE